MKVHVAIAMLISWTLMYAAPLGVPRHCNGCAVGLVSQQGMKGRYPTEAACKNAARQAEADWRKEFRERDEVEMGTHPPPKCVEYDPNHKTPVPPPPTRAESAAKSPGH